MECIDEYQQISRGSNLNPAQKFQFLHNFLTKDVQRSYLDHVAHYVTIFQQAVHLINQEHNSPV